MAITVEMRTQVSQLYVSLFGRAPDSEGLGFWVAALASGMTVSQIAESMYNTAPARTYYPAFATNQEIVATFYQNVLGRPADAEGLAFWTAELTSAANKGVFFTKLLNNVVNYTGTDAAGLKSQALFLNKVAVAQFYGETNGKIDGSSAVLNGVTELPASVDAAKAAITVGTGQTFILTTSQDNVIGTAANDTIRGIYEGEDATVTVGDSVDGGAGNDVLELTAQDGYSTEPGFIVKNVETINIRDLVGASFDAYSVENAPAINFVQTVADNESTVDNAALASRFGLSGKGNMTINYAVSTGAADTANLMLATAGTSATARSTVNVENGNAIEAVNVATTGTNFVTLEAGTGAGTLSITGNGTNTIVVSTMKTTVTIDASASTGTNTIDVGTQLSNKDVFKGGSGADTVKFNTTAAIGAVVFTGVETLTADFDVNSTLNLDGSTGVKTLNVAGSTASAYVTNASADLTTVNITSTGTGATDEGLALAFKEGVVGQLTANVGGTASIEMMGVQIEHIDALTLNSVGTKYNYFGGVDLVHSENVALNINTAAENEFVIGDLDDAFVTGNGTYFTSDDEYFTGNGGGIGSESLGDVNVTVGASADFAAYQIVSETSIGDFSMDTASGASGFINGVGALNGSIGNVDVTVGSGGLGYINDVYASGSVDDTEGTVEGNIGNITLTVASGGVGSLGFDDADDILEYYGDHLGEVFIQSTISSGDYSGGSGVFDQPLSGGVYANGGDVGNIELNITQNAYGYIDVYADSMNTSNGNDYLLGGNIGDLTINAVGASGRATIYAEAYVDEEDGVNGDGGNIGDLNINIDGDGTSGFIYASGGSGGSIGNLNLTVVGSGYASAYADSHEDSSGFGGDIGTTQITLAQDANAAVYLNASGSVGAITVDAGDDTYAWVSAYAGNGDIAATNVVMGNNSYMYADLTSEDGSIGEINVTVGTDSDVTLYVQNAMHVDAMSVVAGAGTDVDVYYAYSDDDWSGIVGSADEVNIAGGASGDTATFDTTYGNGIYSIDSVNLSNWNGDYHIDLSEVDTGTTVYTGKNGGTVVAGQGVDVIYLGAGVDKVKIVTEVNGNDLVYGFKAGAKGDVIEFDDGVFTNFDFSDDFEDGIFSGAGGDNGLQDFVFADLETAVALLEDNTSANINDYSYMFMIDAEGSSDVVVYFADYFNDALVYKAVATLVGVDSADLTAANFSLVGI